MASFSINPLPGMTYKVVINFRDGHQVTQNLPEAEDSGVILSTNNHKNEYFISIKTNPSHKEKNRQRPVSPCNFPKFRYKNI